MAQVGAFDDPRGAHAEHRANQRKPHTLTHDEPEHDQCRRRAADDGAVGREDTSRGWRRLMSLLLLFGQPTGTGDQTVTPGSALATWVAVAAMADDFQGSTHITPFDEDTIAYSKTEADGPIPRLQNHLLELDLLSETEIVREAHREAQRIIDRAIEELPAARRATKRAVLSPLRPSGAMPSAT